MKNLILALSMFLLIGCAGMPYYTSPALKQKFFDEHPNTSAETKEFILKGHTKIGMTKDEVIASIGKPETINTTVLGDSTHEQWVYNYGYSSTLYYFDNDKLTSYQY